MYSGLVFCIMYRTSPQDTRCPVRLLHRNGLAMTSMQAAHLRYKRIQLASLRGTCSHPKSAGQIIRGTHVSEPFMSLPMASCGQLCQIESASQLWDAADPPRLISTIYLSVVTATQAEAFTTPEVICKLINGTCAVPAGIYSYQSSHSSLRTHVNAVACC